MVYLLIENILELLIHKAKIFLTEDTFFMNFKLILCRHDYRMFQMFSYEETKPNDSLIKIHRRINLICDKCGHKKRLPRFYDWKVNEGER